jgi:hypothetical protein
MKFTITDPRTRSQRNDASEDVGRNPSANATLGDVVALRFGRRDLLKGLLGVSAIAATVSPLALAAGRARAAAAPRFDFTEIAAGVDTTHHVAPGYDADILIRWGDPLFADSPEFDPANQTAAAQQKQFGYNCDFIGIVPHPEAPADANRLLMCVNHEYTNEELMFPGLGRQDTKEVAFAGMTAELAAVEMAAHGGSVVEIARGADGKWSYVKGSPFNRRIDATTPMVISGPAAGHDRLKTSADPTGRAVLGMLNNCAGGMTPWGTWLTAEENFHGYFWGEVADGHPEARNHKRYGVAGNWYAWGKFDTRFDVTKEPNEANRFGWMVEIDPRNPNSVPVKRTALGRFKHEGAHSVVNRDGRVVLFQGDDERFDYIYRFVTAKAFDPANPDPDLLDEGTLSVARFDADGKVHWLPLVHGQGPLTAENGFASQADVLIEARVAADLLGATKMDRPEDLEPNPARGTIYAMLTNNSRRKPEQVDAANPRPENRFGHIIEMTAPDMDFAADVMTWEILVRCGDPAIAEVGATFSSATSRDGWFGMPDNCLVDADGRLWVATDGNSGKETGRSDGLWAMETEGELRGTSKLFFRCPAGAELCGPTMNEASDLMLVAVQHPGDDGEDWPEFGRPSTFNDPSTRWPDFKDGVPPRPSVVAITKQGGGRIA